MAWRQDEIVLGHVTHILDKLGVTSRGAAAAAAVRAAYGPAAVPGAGG